MNDNFDNNQQTPVYPNMDYFNKKKKTKNFYFTIKEGISLVKKGGFAYHAEYNTFYHLIENTFEATEICELKEIGTIPYSKLSILGMKYSQYSELFKVGYEFKKNEIKIFINMIMAMSI